VTRLGERWKLASRAAWRLAAGVLLLALGLLTWRGGRSYRDLETLWRDTVERNPQAWMAHYSLANLLDQQGKLDEAVTHHLLALRAKPDHADALHNIGAIRASQGRIPEAIAWYERALRVKPDLATAHYNLALALERAGRTARAIEELHEAIRHTPDPATLTNNMARILYRKGFLGPPPGKAHAALARLMADQGRFEEAIAHCRAALTERPDLVDGWIALGELLAGRGRTDEATACFRRALEIDPENAPARRRLGLAGPSRSAGAG
jgi:tetratricopeptide (TPR) repeat protein